MPRYLPALIVVGLIAPAQAQKPPKARQISPEGPGHAINPRWSRDGNWLAFEREFPNERREMHLLEWKTDEITRRAMPRLDDTTAVSAAFGGKKIKPGDICKELAFGPERAPASYLYACNVADEAFQLFWDNGGRATSDNGGLNTGQAAVHPQRWALLYTASVGNRPALFYHPNVADKRTQPKALFPNAKRADSMPTWSPNGRAAAFVGDGDIYVIRDVSKPETLTRLTETHKLETQPSWSPDGTRVAFFAEPEGNVGRSGDAKDIMVVDLDRGSTTKMASEALAPDRIGPAWTPDGRWIIFVKNMAVGEQVDLVRAVEVRDQKAGEEVKLMTGTTSNRAPDVVEADGEWMLAFSSQGEVKSKSLQWNKIYVMPITWLKNRGGK